MNQDAERVGAVLVSCRNLAEYEQVSECAYSGSSPFLDSPRARQVLSRARVPNEVVSFEAWSDRRTPSRAAPAVDGNRWCLGVGDPVALAVAKFLARASGKRLWPAPDCFALGELAAFERWLSTLEQPSSVTVVCPSWGSVAGEPAPGPWLDPILAVLRRCALNIPVGILTARDPHTLTSIAAKIRCATIASRPIAVFSGLSLEGEPEQLVHSGSLLNKEDAGLPIAYLHEQPRSKLAAKLTGIDWGALVLCGHSRWYCGFEGHCCAARGSDSTDSSCVQGLECFEPSWPRVDPRDLCADLVVFDTCASLSVSREAWADSIAPIAALAAEGRALGVITTVNTTLSGDPAETLFALSTASTVGEATVLIDACRRDRDPTAPRQFFLLGDPDQALPSNFRTLVRESEPTATSGLVSRSAASSSGLAWTETAKSSQPCRIRLDESRARARVDGVTLVSGALTERERSSVFLVRAGRRHEVWLRLPPGKPLPLVSECGLPRLPQEMVEAATDLPRRLLAWGPLALQTVGILLGACSEVTAAQRQLDQLAGHAVAGEISTSVQAVTEQWCRAHSDALKQVSEARGQALTINDLVCCGDRSTSYLQRDCPYCGASAAVCRSYTSFPSGSREYLECEHCFSGTDVPTTGAEVRLRLDSPSRIGADEVRTFSVRVSNGHPRATVRGAVALFIDGLPKHARGVSNPAVMPLTLESQQEVVLSAALSISPTPVRSHIYRVKALALIDGDWFFTQRMLHCSKPTPS
jgi:hypothetical protein